MLCSGKQKYDVDYKLKPPLLTGCGLSNLNDSVDKYNETVMAVLYCT